MTEQNNASWYCENCSLVDGNDVGEFYEDEKFFPQMKKAHEKHVGWKKGKPKSVQQNNDFNKLLQGIVNVFDKADEKTKQREKQFKPIQQVENYLNTQIKSDKEFVRKLIRVSFSAYTNNPINLGVMAGSSEGKTYAVVKVTECFPEKDVIYIGKMSPTALIHQHGMLVDSSHNPIEEKLENLELNLNGNKENLRKSKKTDVNTKDLEKYVSELQKEKKELLRESKNLIDLSCKILVFLDAPNPQLWNTLKPILSHDKYEIEFKTTQTDGSLRVKQSVIRGFPAVIFCSAKNEKKDEMWKEIETRFDITSPNTETKKYRQANQFSILKKGIPEFAKSIVSNDEERKYAQYYIKKIKERILVFSDKNRNPVWNPFYKIIGDKFPSNEGIDMRHCNRFLSYVNVESLINSDFNYVIHFNQNGDKIQKYIITSLIDIENAVKVLGKISIVPPEQLKFLKDVFEPLLKENLDFFTSSNNGIENPISSGDFVPELTSKQIAGKYNSVYGKKNTPKQILENYLDKLEAYGILDYKRNPEDKRQKLFIFSSKPNINNLDFLINEIQDESKKYPLLVWDGVLELERNSYEKGRIEKITDPKGYAIGHNLIQKNIVKA